jgi:ribosomal protein L37E
MNLTAVAGGHSHGSQKQDVGFCSYCGLIGGDQRQRVCSACGLGMRLRTDASALRSPSTPFLIVTPDGRVSAASASAERDLAHVVGQPLAALFDGPDLDRAVARAAAGEGGVVTVALTRTGSRRFRGPVQATVAPCGEPPAALVVLERA